MTLDLTLLNIDVLSDQEVLALNEGLPHAGIHTLDVLVKEHNLELFCEYNPGTKKWIGFVAEPGEYITIKESAEGSGFKTALGRALLKAYKRGIFKI